MLCFQHHVKTCQRSLVFLEWLLNLENQSHAVMAICWARATALAVQLRQFKQYKNIFKSVALSLASCEIKLLLYFSTIANLLVYFILRYFSGYLSYCQPNFGYKVQSFKFCKYIAGSNCSHRFTCETKARAFKTG
jgi:hypothetical protein